MSYTDKELQDIREGENPLAATILLNQSSYDLREIKTLNYVSRHTYIVELENQEQFEDLTIRAVDLPSLWEFLALEYDLANYPVVSIIEKIVTYVDVYPEGEG